MDPPRQVNEDRRYRFEPTQDSNTFTETLQPASLAKGLLTSVYRTFQRGKVTAVAAPKRLTECHVTRQRTCSSITVTGVVRTTPAKKNQHPSLEPRSDSRQASSRLGFGALTIRGLRDSSASPRLTSTQMPKSRSLVQFGEPAASPTDRHDFEKCQKDQKNASPDHRIGGESSESPAIKKRRDPLYTCLKKHVPFQRKHPLHVSQVEMSPVSSTRVFRQSFVQTNSKPKYEVLKQSTVLATSGFETPKEKTSWPLARPAFTRLKTAAGRVVTPFTYKNLSSSETTANEIVNRPRQGSGTTQASRRVVRNVPASPAIVAAPASRQPEGTASSAGYYLRDLEDAFSGRLDGYFGEMFQKHLQKSIATLEAMKDIDMSRTRLRMAPVCLDGQGGVRPAVPENINIYLNYQITTRATAVEPNFYKQSYETIMARKRDSESAVPPRVSSETKTSKRPSLNGCRWRPSLTAKDSKNSFSTDQEAETPKVRKTIIFDLDETLIHSCKSPLEKYDRSVKATMPSRGEKVIGFNVRPFLEELLEGLKDHFELVIFTASHFCYASPILDDIDPNRYFKTRLFREHCDLVEGGVFIKNLSILKDRDLKNVVLVDNSVSSFASQVSNGIPIVPFFDNKADDQLLKLRAFLLRLKDVPDVRPVIEAQFNWSGWKTQYLSRAAAAVKTS